jgi:glutamine synthetase
VEAVTIENVLDAVKDDTHIKVAITDMDGVLRGKFIHIDKFRSALKKGFGFCDVVLGWDMADNCYDNVQFTGWHTGYPDAEVRLDPSTFRRIPWDNNTALLLGEFVNGDESPHDLCPRQILKRVVAKAERMGFSSRIGIEFEWFNFRETPDSIHAKGFRDMTPITPGMFGYSVLRSNLNKDFLADLMRELGAAGVPIEGLHTETGPGVLEVAIANDEPVVAADRAVLFKTGTKEIAYKHGIVATFMAKWNSELPGSSGHMHQSLWRDGSNVFYDESAPNRMSTLFRQYIAGQMKLLPEFLPMLAPTVNSFKRLVDGMWAPTRVTWGVDNRTVALRVIPGSESILGHGRGPGLRVVWY